MSDSQGRPATYTAAELDGLTLGESFQKFVIRDPHVQALGRDLLAIAPVYQPLFEEGRFPNADRGLRWPLYVNTEALSSEFGLVLIDYRPGPEDSPKTTWQNHDFTAGTPRLITNPVMIAQARGNPFFEVSTVPQIAAVCSAITDRLCYWRDFMCRGEVTATGTYSITGVECEIAKTQWTRRDCLIEIGNNDFLPNDQSSSRWMGVVLNSTRLSTAEPLDTSTSKPRHIANKQVQMIVREYIQFEERNGAKPTLSGLEEFRKRQGIVGKREDLRSVFKRIYEAQGRGRPKGRSRT